MLERRGILALCAAAGIGAGVAGFSRRLVEMIPITSRGRKALHPIYGNADTPEWLRDPKTGAFRQSAMDAASHGRSAVPQRMRAQGQDRPRHRADPAHHRQSLSSQHAQRLCTGQHADDRDRTAARDRLRPRQHRNPERLRSLSDPRAAQAQGAAGQRAVAADFLGAADRRNLRGREDLRRHRRSGEQGSRGARVPRPLCQARRIDGPGGAGARPPHQRLRLPGWTDRRQPDVFYAAICSDFRQRQRFRPRECL